MLLQHSGDPHACACRVFNASANKQSISWPIQASIWRCFRVLEVTEFVKNLPANLWWNSGNQQRQFTTLTCRSCQRVHESVQCHLAIRWICTFRPHWTRRLSRLKQRPVKTGCTNRGDDLFSVSTNTQAWSKYLFVLIQFLEQYPYGNVKNNE